MKQTTRFIHKTVLTMLVVVFTTMTAWAQEKSEKFSLTTQMFLDELKEQTTQSTNNPHHAPVKRLPGTFMQNQQRLIASPDTVDGIAYISCFIHLKDVSNLSAVRTLGVRIEETFDGTDFVTARVPVGQLESLADIDNVTCIKVAQLMSPFTDVSRQQTHVDDLLTLSSSALAQGLDRSYDGTGVVLGIIDTGIDFHHIAFKDKDGNSRIKRAYVYKGSGTLFSNMTHPDLTTDDNTEDHGTHTASTAGGSSVIVDGSAVAVTNDHANATYGGMAPGADLFLAGVKGLADTGLTNALKHMVAYADSVGKPLVVSNSWGSYGGAHDGTGNFATLLSQYFGDSHPNHIILFSSANNAGRSLNGESGGFFVKKNSASSENPLGTIIQTEGSGGDSYAGLIASAWSSSEMNCKLYVLDNSTGEVITATSFTTNTPSYDGLSAYYKGTLSVNKIKENDKYRLAIYSSKGCMTESTNAYTLAIEVYPASGSADVNMWAGNSSYFTNHVSTESHTWTAGTDDMSVCDEATFPDVISVGAYISKERWTNYENSSYGYTFPKTLGDIAFFSSYATAAQSPTGEAYPWITAPGSVVVAGINHFHTKDVDSNSFYDDKKPLLVVNNANNPYGVMQGTSMSTPVAAGIVALWLQAATEVGKNLTVNNVKDIMKRTAIQDEYTTTGANASHFGHGKIDALAGIRYITAGPLDLFDNTNNSNAISTAETSGKAYNVTINDRTLWKDGEWNTLCLPFNVALSGSVLEGAEARELSSANLSEGTLTLTFSDPVSTLLAGKPYIVKWAGDGSNNIIAPVFTGVTLNSGYNNFTSGNVSFKGTYTPLTFATENKNILFLGGGNKLYYPDGDNSITIGAFRAYFQLDGAALVKDFRLSFGDEESTGLMDMEIMESMDSPNAWYTLDGRKLNGKPTIKGMYIHNGRKIIIP